MTKGVNGSGGGSLRRKPDVENGVLYHAYSSINENNSKKQVQKAFSLSANNVSSSSPSSDQGHSSPKKKRKRRVSSWYHHVAGQIPAVMLICILNLMFSIPFGVSYFPIGWRVDDNASVSNGGDSSGNDDEVNGGEI
eukprot:14442603-Ditylum_brightwellii.AAC.1